MSRKTVSLGSIILGGSGITVQSMLNRPPHDIKGNVEQAVQLMEAGCDIIRVAVPDMESVKLIPHIKERAGIPLVADIHFDYRLALEAVAAGVDKIRINPGNIGERERVKAVVDACRLRGVPIRVGVNSGSVERELLAKYGAPTPEAMCDSAMNHVKLLESMDFDSIVVSIKSSDVRDTVTAYRLLHESCPYPLHVGVTEAGTRRMGIIKSAMGIGALLVDGIGDTIRVSLTADPVEEVHAARDILRGLGLMGGVEVISCPTCGRTNVDVIGLAEETQKALSGIKKRLKVAVMGCVVNGPGEADSADIGICGGGEGFGLLLIKGEKPEKVPSERLLQRLLYEIDTRGLANE